MSGVLLSASRIVVPVCVFNGTINCEVYLHVEGQHFHHLLWSVNCKIHMHLAAGGAPVAVKRRTLYSHVLTASINKAYKPRNSVRESSSEAGTWLGIVQVQAKSVPPYRSVEGYVLSAVIILLICMCISCPSKLDTCAVVRALYSVIIERRLNS
jgi:hypothetical protein